MASVAISELEALRVEVQNQRHVIEQQLAELREQQATVDEQLHRMADMQAELDLLNAVIRRTEPVFLRRR